MIEYPDVPPIPPGWKIPPHFEYSPLFAIYKRMRNEEGHSTAEIAALEVGIEAFFFLTGFQPPPGSDYIVARETTDPKNQVFFWMNRTQPLLDYLDAYLSEVRSNGTSEQIKLLRDILDKPEDQKASPSCSIDNDDDQHDDVNKVDSFPEPSEAITILDRIAQRCGSTSVEYVALQITIRALRHLIENGEAPEFMRYVDQMSKWEPSPVE
jgi:hypothetical protein